MHECVGGIGASGEGVHVERFGSMMNGVSQASCTATARLPTTKSARASAGGLATTAAKPGRRASVTTVAAAARIATTVATAMLSRIPALAVNPTTPPSAAATVSTKRGNGRLRTLGMGLGSGGEGRHRGDRFVPSRRRRQEPKHRRQQEEGQRGLDGGPTAFHSRTLAVPRASAHQPSKKGHAVREDRQAIGATSVASHITGKKA